MGAPFAHPRLRFAIDVPRLINAQCQPVDAHIARAACAAMGLESWQVPAYGYLEGIEIRFADLVPNMDAANPLTVTLGLPADAYVQPIVVPVVSPQVQPC